MENSTFHPVPAKSLEIVLNTEKRNSGGNFTIRSKKTQKDYTYRIKRTKRGEEWVTDILIEKQYLQFHYLGTYKNGVVIKWRGVNNSDTAKGIAWVLKNIEQGNFAKVEEQADLFHTNHCLRCGKELTDATSIELGLGPVCRTTN